MSRPDPVLNMFKTQNFMPLLVPQSGISPLQLVGIFDKDLSPLGQLGTTLKAPAGISLPPIIPDIGTASSWEGMSSAQVNISIGLQILGNILQALTGQTLDVSDSFKNAKTMKFTFQDVSADKVEINVLDQYLGKAEIDPSGKQLHQMLIDDQVGVLTMTLKSKKFVTSGQDQSGNDVALQVPVIHGVASGSLKVGMENDRNTQLSYEGITPVTFAAQGVQLFFDDAGHYTAFDPFKAGQHAVRGLQAQGADTRHFEPKLLTIEGAFARWQTGTDIAPAGQQK